MNVMAEGSSSRDLGKLRLTRKSLLAENLIRHDPETYADDVRAARKDAEDIWHAFLTDEERDK